MAELPLDVKKQQWLTAQRWRQQVTTCLETAGLNFNEWLVLDATWLLVNRSGNAVSQAEVARNLELDAMTLWHAMAVLEHRGLVSRGRTLSGAWRVFVTQEGVDRLRAIEPRLELASASGS